MTQSTNAGGFSRTDGGLSWRATVLMEWLLVLPATAFLAVAALRLMQPSQFEPARTLRIIFEWLAGHISYSGAAVVFLAMPALAFVVGCTLLFRLWRRDETLRRDTMAAVSILWRHGAPYLLVAATLLAGGILAAVVDHLIVG